MTTGDASQPGHLLSAQGRDSEDSQASHYNLQNLIDRFYQLDIDQDGWLSNADLSEVASTQDKNESAFFQRITESLRELGNMHDDDGLDSKGVTLADLDEMQNRVEAATAALDAFSHLDNDHDRYLSVEELKDGEYLIGASNVRYLVQNSSELEELHNGEIGDENNGISSFDLGSTCDDPLLEDSESVQRIEAAQYAEQCFEYLDGDYDGYITSDDLNRRDYDAYHPELRYLMKNFSQFEEIFDDNVFEELGITRNDVATALNRPGWDSRTNTLWDPGSRTGLR